MSALPQPVEVHYVDETTDGRRTPACKLRLASEKITVRELIQRRVEHEVAAYNQKPARHFQGLVQPSETERTLNGYRLKKRRQLDAARQTRVALEAFEANGFFVLFDDRQVDSLDDEVVLTGKNTVSFVRLLPLVGG